MKKSNSFAIILSLVLLFTQVTPVFAAAPIITINPTTLTVNEGSTITIDTSATVTDADSTDFDTGTLTIDVTNSPSGTDNLSFLTNGGYTRVGIPNNWNPNGTVSFGGTQFGTYSGWMTKTLVFTFDTDATPAIVQGLLQRIRYQEADNTPNAPLARNVQFDLTDGDGGSATDTVIINITVIDDAPVINWSWNNPSPITYTENDSPLRIDDNVSITDTDDGSLNTLTFSIMTNCVAAEDVLGIGNYGTITTSGTNVLDGATIIGTFAGGSACTPLVVTLNTNDTDVSMTALGRAFTYENISDNPDTVNQRRLRLEGTNVAGDVKFQRNKYLSVLAANDAPLITFAPAPTSATEQTWTIMDGSATVADPDVPTAPLPSFPGTLTATITNMYPGDRLNVRDEGTAAGQIGRTGVHYANPATISYGGTNIGVFTWAGSTATITLNASATIPAVQALVRNIQFVANVNNPNTTQRVVDFTITDSASDTSPISTKLVNVVPVNDDPVVSNFLPSPIAYIENAPSPLRIDNDVSILDPEYTNYNGGALTVSFSANGTVDDQLAIGNIGNITTSGASVIYAPPLPATWSCTIGSYSGGVNGADLVVNFDQSDQCAINSRITALLQALTYSNPSENPAATRTVQIIVTDGDGGASAAVTKVINVTPINDEPYFDMGADQPVAPALVLEDAGAQSVANWATNIDDGDLGTQTLTFTLSNDNNGLFSTQPAIAADGTLTYTPTADANGIATITVVSLQDDGGTANGGDDTYVPASNTFTITVTAVNDEPSFTTGGDVTVAEDSGAYDAAWATAISAGPADESGQTLTFTVTNDDNTLFSAQPDIDPATGNLSFTPATNANGTATVTVYLADDGGTANLGDDTYGPITFTITITSGNDGPTDIDLDNNTVAENEPVNTFVGSLITTDIDLPSDSHTYTLVTGVLGCDSSGNASFNINNDDLHTSVVFDYETPPTSFNVCIQTEDNGNATYTESFTITITNVNEAPVNTVPAAQTTDDNIPLTFSTANGNLISTDDVDAGTADLEVTLVVTSGTITLNGTTGLSFTAGSNGSASMTFEGTLTEINTALDGLVYTPNLGFSGLDSLSITTDDQGATGSGGAQSDTDTVVIDVVNIPPQVVSAGVNSIPDTGDGVLAEGEVAHVGITSLTVTFNEAMDNTTAGDQVSNPDNYLLLSYGQSLGFQTTSCAQAKNVGVDPGDTQVTVDSVTYNGTAPFTVTLNLSTALTSDYYRLYACGTATLRDLAGNALAGDGVNVGSDFIRNFRVRMPTALPETGFTPGQGATLSAQPDEKSYANIGMILEIPTINQKLFIAGVPETETGWDVSWLGNNAGYLAGSAFPTWSGNTLLTGHVWSANNQPGPFAELNTLSYGDYVYIHSYGKVYTYEVRTNNLVKANNIQSILKHEELDWVTLITCESYDESSDNYLSRRIVRAVLVDVK